MPAQGQFANALTPGCVLVAPIGVGDDSCIVSNPANFPALTIAQQCRMAIQDALNLPIELVLVTAMSGGTFTIQRGIDSSVPSAHAVGASVWNPLTADDMATVYPAVKSFTSGSSYTVLPNDGIIDVATGGLFTVDLNPATMKIGKRYTIVDALGVCNSFNITLNAISGVFTNLTGTPASFAMQTNGMSASVYTPDGVNLRIV